MVGTADCAGAWLCLHFALGGGTAVSHTTASMHAAREHCFEGACAAGRRAEGSHSCRVVAAAV